MFLAAVLKKLVISISTKERLQLTHERLQFAEVFGCNVNTTSFSRVLLCMKLILKYVNLVILESMFIELDGRVTWEARFQLPKFG